MTPTYDDATVTYDATDVTYDGTSPQFDGVTVTVQAAFGYAPLDTSPVWTDVTQWVRDIRINRGRRSEYVATSVGTANVKLDNRDRRFDPEYTSSPYNGDLNPMVPVRIQANYNSTTYTMFYGFAQGWPTAYEMPNVDAVTQLTLLDATRLLANAQLPEYALQHEVSTDDAWRYYPMQSFRYVEGTYPYLNYTHVDDYLERGALVAQTSSSLVQQSLPVGADLSFNGGTASSFTDLTSSAPATETVEFWFSADATDFTGSSSVGVLARRVGGAGDYQIDVRMYWDNASSQWELQVIQYDSDATSLYGSAVPYAAVTVVNGMNHVIGTRDGSNFKVYLNGSLIYTLALSGSGSVSPSQSDVGTYNGNTGAYHTLSHVAVYEKQFTSTDVTRHYDAGLGNPELSSARLNRVLDDASWPTAWRNIETGVQNVNGYLPANGFASRYWQQIVNAEQGEIFVNREGHVEMLSRTTLNTVNIVGVFDDTGTDTPFSDIDIDSHSIDTIRNSIVVDYTGGSAVATDTASVTAYGESVDELDARLIDNLDDATNIADARLARRKDPATRITMLDVNVRSDAATAVPTIAALELGDNVAVVFTPTGVGDALWRAVTVQGIRHTVTRDSWRTQLYLTPSAINANGALLVLNDDTYGRLDEGNRLG